MLELQRLLAEYKAHGSDASDVPVFDNASFQLGKYSDGAVLKFRGIICDVFDPELVLLSDDATENSANAPPPVQDLTGDKFIERVPIKVALVPHVNDWAKQRYHASSRMGTVAATTDNVDTDVATTKGTKRSNDALVIDAHQHEGVNQQTTEMEMESDGVKKAKPANATEATSEADAPAFSESVVSIYVYDGQYDGLGVDVFKVNEAFEFVGVLDLMVMSAGSTGIHYDDGFTAESIAELTISDCLEGIQRKQQSSVVLHCCDAQRLDAIHFVQPHKPRAVHTALQTNTAKRDLLTTRWKPLVDIVGIVAMRKALIEYLARAVGGDELAAEYMLLCLLSRVTSRPDNATVLGNLSVNMSLEKNVPASVMTFLMENLSTTLGSIVPILASVDMSIKSLNSVQFLPHKDYDNDMLRGGLLQFAHGTVVVVNETVLSTGNLNDQGVKNVGALQSLVEKMLLPYDFQYYSMDFPQDVAVVSLSQGKSILPVHVSVPVELVTASSSSPASDAMLECFRLFLAVVRMLEVVLGNEQAEIAEKHFVACRKAKQDVSADDLHRWLRLARLVALSYGDDSVSATSWQHMLDLEGKRIARLDSLAQATN